LDAEFTTLEPLLLETQDFTAHTLLLLEEVFAELTVMLTALWEELDATQPTNSLSKDLTLCGTLEMLDASTSAQPSSHKEPSETTKVETPLLADCTTLKLLSDLETLFTAPTLPPTEPKLADLTPVLSTANKSSPHVHPSTRTTPPA
jgi:hypothetical protein